jgi:hypothetical protein
MVEFVRTLYGFFANGPEGPDRGGGSGQRSAAAPGGAWNLAGMVLHRVTLSAAGYGLFPVVQPRLIYFNMYSTFLAVGEMKNEKFKMKNAKCPFRRGSALGLEAERRPGRCE